MSTSFLKEGSEYKINDHVRSLYWKGIPQKEALEQVVEKAQEEYEAEKRWVYTRSKSAVSWVYGGKDPVTEKKKAEKEKADSARTHEEFAASAGASPEWDGSEKEPEQPAPPKKPAKAKKSKKAKKSAKARSAHASA